MARTVDRGLARLVALKRIMTGGTGLVAGAVCVVIALAHGGAPPGQLLLAIAIFWGGGAWTLRDGLRLKRELDASR